MPNCDWGRPCDCVDCRTKTFDIKCISCGFDTTVSYVMYSEGGKTDKKGLFSYDFGERNDNSSEIKCYSCGHLNQNVPYFEKVETEIIEYRLNQKVCVDCGIKEFDKFNLHFVEWKSETFCSSCVEKRYTQEVPDPSTDSKTFKLDIKSMKYVLAKVKVPCVSCGRQRWVKAENQWKKQCMNCYKKILEAKKIGKEVY